jgi:hypothetical protein
MAQKLVNKGYIKDLIESLSGLTDTELSAKTDGHVLTYDVTTDMWVSSGLTNTLSGYVPYISATTNVDLGTNELDAQSLTVNGGTLKIQEAGGSWGMTFSTDASMNGEVSFEAYGSTHTPQNLIGLNYIPTGNLPFRIWDSGGNDAFLVAGNLKYAPPGGTAFVDVLVAEALDSTMIANGGNRSLVTKEYVDGGTSGLTNTLSGLTDTTFAITPIDGQSLTWNDSASSWSATTTGGGSSTISGSTDVTFAITPTDGQSLTWNATASSWTATTVTSGTGNLQKNVTGDYTVLSGDNNYTIWLLTSTGTTVTVDDDLPDNFECSFYNNGAGDVWFTGGTATLSAPSGNNLAQDNVCTIIKRESNNDYKLKGELGG